MSDPVRLLRLGVFATAEQIASIRELHDLSPRDVPAEINRAAAAQGLPDTAAGYGICLSSREFIGLAPEDLH